MITGNGRASPLDGNLCSLLHLGRPQLKQVASTSFWHSSFFSSSPSFCNFSRFYPVQSLKNLSCRKDSGQSGWWQLSKFPSFHDSMESTKCHFLPPLLKLENLINFHSPSTHVYLQTVQPQWSTPTRMREPPQTSLSSDRNCSMLNQYLQYIQYRWAQVEMGLAKYIVLCFICAQFASYAVR